MSFTATPPDAMSRNLWFGPAGADLAIVFVHGFRSNVRDCWLCEEQPNPIYWPVLVQTDPALQDWGVFLAGYDADGTGGRGISHCSEDLYRDLQAGDGPLRRKGLVFVCHSLGGVVVRQLLADHYEDFREKRIHLMLLASPSRGAGFPRWIARLLLGAVGLFRRDVRLPRELAVDTGVLEQLDKQFGRLLKDGDTRRLTGLSGVEISELASLKALPLVGRVVRRGSSERYFPAPQQLAGADHATVCKPASREAPVHATLREGCALVAQSLGVVSPGPRRPAAVRELADALTDLYGFRYEAPSLGDQSASFAVYWPIRLRPPTPIHAQQTFVAAALSRLNVPINLWIDDLGHQDYGVGMFEQRLRHWFQGAAGVAELLKVRRFSEELGRSASMEQAWTLARKWLGDTSQSLREILTLSKLDPAQSLDILLNRRPRRLLTPPIVWLGLRLTAADSQPVLTLGGWDEVDLWSAWRTLGIDDQISAGHLYGAKLTTIGRGGAKESLRMKTHDLAWTSRDDIRRALYEAERAAKSAQPDFETLPAWCLIQCVYLPQFLVGTHPALAVGDRAYHTVEEVWNLATDKRIDSLVSALDASILR